MTPNCIMDQDMIAILDFMKSVYFSPDDVNENLSSLRLKYFFCTDVMTILKRLRQVILHCACMLREHVIKLVTCGQNVCVMYRCLTLVNGDG